MPERKLSRPQSTHRSRRDEMQGGQVVEVSRGQLTGVRGVLLQRTADRRWVIQLDDFPQGVLLVIDAIALVLCRCEPAATSPTQSSSRCPGPNRQQFNRNGN